VAPASTDGVHSLALAASLGEATGGYCLRKNSLKNNLAPRAALSTADTLERLAKAEEWALAPLTDAAKAAGYKLVPIGTGAASDSRQLPADLLAAIEKEAANFSLSTDAMIERLLRQGLGM
jgi:hypothetical protein